MRDLQPDSLQAESKSAPGLAALRSFVLTVDYGSYSRAARVLGLTHTAVMQGVRSLERHFGTPLVARRARVIEATERGAELHLQLRSAVKALDAAMLREPDPGRHPTPGRLVISTLPAFANGWLLQRFSRLQARLPGCEVVLETRLGIEDIDSNDTDISIRLGDGRWDDVRVDPFMRDAVFPIASPSSPRAVASMSAQDLAHAPLIENRLRPWSEWFASRGIFPERLRTVLTVSDSHTAQCAAEAGIGVALGRACFVATGIRSGQLFRVGRIETEESMWWMVRPRLPKGRNARIVSEAAATLLQLARNCEREWDAVMDAPTGELERSD